MVGGLDVLSFPVAGSKYRFAVGLDVTNFPVEGSKYRFSGLSLEGLDNELSVLLMFPILFLLMRLNFFPKNTLCPLTSAPYCCRYLYNVQTPLLLYPTKATVEMKVTR